MNVCACGCGKTTNGTWARGHHHRLKRETGYNALTSPSFLSPDDPDSGEDLGLAEPAPAAAPPAAPSPSPSPAPDAEDAGPAHATREWRKPSKGKSRSPKVTAGIRTDIHAKISLPLEITGRLWEARDPWCGGAFVKQRAEVADALTDIVCDSADLVNFFTGPAGGFMKYLNLGAALWPVAEMVGAHHVYKTIEEPQPDPNAPQQVYRA